MIYNPRGGFIDIREVVTFRTEFLMSSKKYVIIFVTKQGIQIHWQFDKVEERDNTVAQILEHIRKEKRFTEIANA